MLKVTAKRYDAVPIGGTYSLEMPDNIRKHAEINNLRVILKVQEFGHLSAQVVQHIEVEVEP